MASCLSSFLDDPRYRFDEPEPIDPAVEARNQLVEENTNLAYKMVARLWARDDIKRAYHNCRDDVVQVALLTLVKAAELFDPARGYQFSTFACAAIVREIIKHKTVSVFHMPANVVRDVAAVDAGRRTTSGRRCIEAGRKCLALKRQDASLWRESAPWAIEQEAVPDIVARLLDGDQDRERLEELLVKLPARHARMIRLRFGFDDGVARTFRQVGDLLGVTPQCVEQTLKVALPALGIELARSRYPTAA